MLKKITKTVMLSLVLPLLMILIISCGGKKENDAVSMEQLHAEIGIPVSVRELAPEDFSVFLKYPAIINASSESTAYAALNDVVRNIAVNVGDTVRQNDTIISFSQDNQMLQQAALAFENASGAYNRLSALFRSGDISRQEFDTVRMQYEIARTNFNAANDMVFVKAPISGTITQINVRVTENVRPGSPLFTVSNNNAYEARLYVGADEIDKIHAGARAFINLSRARQESRRTAEDAENIEGRVIQVSLNMDSQKQSFPVTVSFDGASRKLISGMNVDIAVETYRNEEAIVLLRREIAETENGHFVYVVENNEVKAAPVQLGEEMGMFIEISGGLNKGDIIVSEGIKSINAGSKINIVPSILPAGQ